jgi:hypothetical protein
MVWSITHVQFRYVENRMVSVSLGSVFVVSKRQLAGRILTQHQVEARKIAADVGHIVCTIVVCTEKDDWFDACECSSSWGRNFRCFQ